MELNKIYNMDCLMGMKEMDSESVDLIVSSPPYNLSIDYGSNKDSLSFNDYLRWHEEVLRECVRLLKKGGRLAWQVGATRNEGTYFPLNSWVAMKLIELGLHQRCEIVWNKEQITSRTAWGSFNSPSDNTILPCYEYIELFNKEPKKLQEKGESNLDKASFIKWTKGLWSVPCETNSSHPAPFPEEIPRRLILMNTYKNQIVLDPFMGSGTTGVAAAREGRRFIGFEENPDFCKMATNRISAILQQHKLF